MILRQTTSLKCYITIDVTDQELAPTAPCMKTTEYVLPCHSLLLWTYCFHSSAVLCNDVVRISRNALKSNIQGIAPEQDGLWHATGVTAWGA